MDLSNLRGKYKAVPIDGGLGETSTGKEEVAVSFELLAEELKGERITWYGYFTDGTVDSTIKALRACGWKGTNAVELLDWKKAVSAPTEVELVIEPEAQQKDGKPVVDAQGNVVMRARVRWVNPVGRNGLREPLAVDKAAAFADRMRAKLVAFDQSAATPKANGAVPPISPPRAPVKDPGDVPF
jgi:hypothetical protein